VSYEHIFEVSGEVEQKFEIPYSSKGKKLKKSKKDQENAEEPPKSIEVHEVPKEHQLLGLVEWDDNVIAEDESK
jgi:hypothetical protein